MALFLLNKKTWFIFEDDEMNDTNNNTRAT